MLPALILALVALGFAALRLWGYRRQMEEMARVLEETPAESNLRLTVGMDSAPARRLCRAVNRRLEEGRRLRAESLKGEQELRYTMACISHDIRTPLAGAMGYLQLLEVEPDRREEYLGIVQKRLTELDSLLGELFLYTRLLNEAVPLECGKVAALPPLWEALAEFYPQLEAAGVEPELRFDREELAVWAEPAASAHSASRKPTSTKSFPTRMGRFTSIPSEASRANCSCSLIWGSLSFSSNSLYFKPLVLKNFFRGRLLRSCQLFSSAAVGGASLM